MVALKQVSPSIYGRCPVVFVPRIADIVLADMRAKIEPLIRLDQKFYRIAGIEQVDSRMVAYTWSAKPTGHPLYFTSTNRVELITYHTFGAPSLFKPSLAEVYAQIRRMVPDWSMVKFFWLDSDNLDSSHIIGNCHWCRCVLFGDAAQVIEERIR